jgi:hypothetical protein
MHAFLQAGAQAARFCACRAARLWPLAPGPWLTQAELNALARTYACMLAGGGPGGSLLRLPGGLWALDPGTLDLAGMI